MEWPSREGIKAQFIFECSECDWVSKEKLERYGSLGWSEMFERIEEQHKQKQYTADNPCRGLVKIRDARISYENKSLELEDGSALGFCTDCFWVGLFVIKKGIEVNSLYELLKQRMKLSHNKLGGHTCNPSARKLLIRLHQE